MNSGIQMLLHATMGVVMMLLLVCAGFCVVIGIVMMAMIIKEYAEEWHTNRRKD